MTCFVIVVLTYIFHAIFVSVMAAKLSTSESQVAEIQSRLNISESHVANHQSRLDATEVQVGDLEKGSEGNYETIFEVTANPMSSFWCMYKH